MTTKRLIFPILLISLKKPQVNSQRLDTFTANMKITRDSSVKKIPHSALTKICNLLDVDSKYRELAMNVKKRTGDLMFNTDDIK